VYLELTRRLKQGLAAYIRAAYEVEIAVVLERPPKIEMGEAASPVCFELAKRLKKAPRMIAQEIANGIGKIAGITKIEVAGAGYLNAYFDRGRFWESGEWQLTLRSSGSTSGEKEAVPQELKPSPAGPNVGPKAPTPNNERNRDRRGAEGAEVGGEQKRGEKVIVEHTSINPNKAAHIGHVRNAVLGDTMARVLRATGERVQVQNYIDNTGVQVADVVIGFLHMEKRSPVNVKNLAIEPKFDYYCWDLYAKATHFFAEDKARAAELRGATLKAMEEGHGEEAEVAQVVADAIVGYHLRTMARLGIGYDLLARESEILHLKFWDAAFSMLKESKAIEFVTEGKMAGCWVMAWKEELQEGEEVKEAKDRQGLADVETAAHIEDTEQEEEISQDKIIVRSNGTVTYVGKDIAYQLWKFGLLGKDFRYARWVDAPAGEEVWATTADASDPAAPHFGEPAAIVYNVIDVRQSYPQDVVEEGLRRLGHLTEASRSIHFSYGRVVLTPRCAEELGYELSPEETKKAYVEVSGRLGLGVKADDLIDKLEAAALAEVQKRHAEMSAAEQEQTAHAIAVGALRFFLLKFARNTIIAFDFGDALSFEGETGPYCQYAVVRIRGIRRKGEEAASGTASIGANAESAAKYLNNAEGAGLWELLLQAGSLDHAADAVVGAQEPAFLAKYAFQLAQAFNNFYHKHHILSEADAEKRAFLLALTQVVEKQLVKALDLLGIEAPEKM
jgi:arginyl-tRNA synthetase